MRTVALIYIMMILILAMVVNIAKRARTVSDARSSVVAAILNILMIISVIYLYNSGDSA